MASVSQGVHSHGRAGLVFALICLAAGTGAIVVGASGQANALEVDVVRLGVWLTGPVAGALLLDREARHPVGILLAASGLVPAFWLLGTVAATGSLADIDVTAQSEPFLVVTLLALVAGVLVVLPDEDPTSRPVVLGATAVAAAALSLVVLGLGRLDGTRVSWNSALPLAATGLAGSAALTALTYRARSAWRASGPEARRQRWLIALTVTLAAGGVATGVSDGTSAASTVLAYVGAGVHAAAVLGVALVLLSDDLPEVGFSVARLALLAVATAVLALTYGLVLTSLAWTDLPNRPAAAAAATALVAVALLPGYIWARDRIAVLLYGTGQRPALALTMLSRSLDTAGEAEDTLRAACEAVAAAVRSPAVAVVLGDGATDPPAGSIAVPLQADGQFIGTLTVAPRRPGEPYSRREVDLVTTLAATLAQVARATALASALEAARRDLADERQDERRRLRRDLHDGLGPLLASLGLRLDRLERSVPAAMRSDVAELKDVVATSRREVRRLVEGLAPQDPERAIDLEQALDELVEGWASATTPQGLSFDLQVVGQVPPLPGDVATAVYRIAGEAITNVVRHARATTCLVRLAGEPTGLLTLEVCDDGTGIRSGSGGFGLRSMQERAASLGATVETSVSELGGTVVRLRLPTAPEGALS